MDSHLRGNDKKTDVCTGFLPDPGLPGRARDNGEKLFF